ncbi:DUF6643 family protein [Streptomyces sp. Z26]|uniref:DUF6643 family protein n=1 Tax=Streptomyces TaxID=1883 RepID=UPI000EF160A0|nr:DUF6643 family protein [Streptomyces sp. Z26]RLL69967.1 hypothetical protein D7M15_27720 [Streptomyces sp. Z26]
MTSPRGTYGGGYYAAPPFPDTPIYDMLVAERGTPQIAPIRVPAQYEASNYLPALPAALPALPSGSGYGQQSQTPPHGYPAAGPPAPQPMPLQQAPMPYVPQQQPPRGPQGGQPGYPGHPGMGQQAPQQQPQRQPQMRPVQPPRPAAPRQMPGAYDDPYGRPYPGRGY